MTELDLLTIDEAGLLDYIIYKLQDDIRFKLACNKPRTLSRQIAVRDNEVLSSIKRKLEQLKREGE